MKILITGATGLIGTALVKKLKEKGHTVNMLTRNKTHKPNEFQWNVKENFIEDAAFEGVECIIHLAGASIGKRWTPAYKKELTASRIDTAKLLKSYVEKHHIHLKSVISSSGVNYYGTFTSPEILTEELPIRNLDFLAQLSKEWEEEAFQFSAHAERIVCLRTAMVLAKEGGSFPALKRLADFNLASPVGSGEQWMNWIHIDVLVNLYAEAVENNTMQGSYNAVADEITHNKDFMKMLAQKAKKFFLPIAVPKCILQLVLGQMSSIVLEGTRASNQKIKSTGFIFQYDKLDKAFDSLL